LNAELQDQWRELQNLLCIVALNSENDKPVWKWSKNGHFSVKSLYEHLCINGIDRSFRHLWKAKIPLKIKVWLWLIWHNAIATKDNMVKRNWTGNTKCRLSECEEPIHHLFFSCDATKYVWSCVAKAIGAPTSLGSFSQFFGGFPNFYQLADDQIAGIGAICWAIWKIRNKACFEKKLIKSPLELICYATVFMKYWAGLNSTSD
jgi:hypothetical protein